MTKFALFPMSPPVPLTQSRMSRRLSRVSAGGPTPSGHHRATRGCRRCLRHHLVRESSCRCTCFSVNYSFECHQIDHGDEDGQVALPRRPDRGIGLVAVAEAFDTTETLARILADHGPLRE